MAAASSSSSSSNNKPPSTATRSANAGGASTSSGPQPKPSTSAAAAEASMHQHRPHHQHHTPTGVVSDTGDHQQQQRRQRAAAASVDLQPARGPNPIQHLLQRQLGNNVPGFRRRLYRERLNVARNLYRRDLMAHYGCVNAIEFSDEGELLVSGGDDRRVLLWHMADAMVANVTGKPFVMRKQHQSNIFCLAVTKDNTKILSGGNDDLVMTHDTRTGEWEEVFRHEKPVYGISLDPLNPSIFATAGEDGRCLLYDMRTAGGAEVQVIAKYRSPFHAVQFHPLDGNFVITANGKEGAAFWDLRHAKTPSIRYGGDDAAQSCMSVRFNGLGSQVLALRRRLPPILFNTYGAVPVCQFYHQDYYNSCTMKSCCFAGEDDEFVLSGSDDFNLYVWRVSDAASDKTNQWIDNFQMVLNGHRSIVNQVRYNAGRGVIASSGVEKVIKLWSPFASDGWVGGPLVEESTGFENLRDVFTHEEYMSILNTSGHTMTHDYSNQSTSEDPRMMAFFDSLVQREIEGWNSHEGSEQSSEHSSMGSLATSIESDDDVESARTADLYPARSVAPNSRVRIRGGYIVCSGARFKRKIYANRIAYLIATKRNTLKRLAQKGFSQTERRSHRMRTSSTRNLRTARMGAKRAGRSNANKRTAVSHEDHDDDNNDNERGPRKLTKRRIQQHLNTPTYRIFRRKTKAVRNTRLVESPDTSSDDDDDTFDKQNSSEDDLVGGIPTDAADDNEATPLNQPNASIPSTSAGPSTSSRSVARPSSSSASHHAKYELISAQMRRAQNANRSNGAAKRNVQQSSVSRSVLNGDSDDDSDDDDDEDDSAQPTGSSNGHTASVAAATSNTTATTSTPRYPTNIAVPSTSTGITTTTGQLFRAQLQQQLLHDSDEEDEPTPPISRPDSPLHLVRVIPMPINGTRNFNATYSSSGLDEREDHGNGGDEDDDDGLDSSPIGNAHHMNFTTDEDDASDVSDADSDVDSNDDDDDDDDEDGSDAQLERHFHQSQVRRKRNAPFAHTAQYSSHSNSRLSNSSPECEYQNNNHINNTASGRLPDGGAASSYFGRKKPRLQLASDNTANTSSSSSATATANASFMSSVTTPERRQQSMIGSDVAQQTVTTPIGDRRSQRQSDGSRRSGGNHVNTTFDATPDSGIAMLATPHSAGSASNSFHNHSSSSSSVGNSNTNGGGGGSTSTSNNSFRKHFEPSASSSSSSSAKASGSAGGAIAIPSTSHHHHHHHYQHQHPHRMFQQKVARVRRNYLRDFGDDDNESDSD